jgi:hypothetical protein
MIGYTLGGRPLNEAKSWTAEVNQEFGAILYKLFSTKFNIQYEGYQEFFIFRRDFTEEVFNEQLNALDAFRKERRGIPIREILARIRQNAGEGIDEPINVIEGVSIMGDKSLEQICTGLKLIGEGLIGLSENLYKGAGVEVAPGKAEAKPEVKPEAKPETVDFAALRKKCADKMLALVNQGKKPEVIKVLADLKAKRLPEVKDEQLQDLLETFATL